MQGAACGFPSAGPRRFFGNNAKNEWEGYRRSI